MKIRPIILLALFAFGLGGCNGHAVRRAQQPPPQAEPPPPAEPPRQAPRAEDEMYEGYYHVRVIFIKNTPFHVHDDRRVYPIPRHLHRHFKHGRHHRVFGWRHVPGVRDGYHLSRIVYLKGVPYYVEDDRTARPLPRRLHNRFAYADYEQRADDDMYEGYFYIRIVFINNVPYHVQDDRRAYPIPHHLHEHFRQRTRHHRTFGWHQEDGMRDGYRLGRIVYINDVPHHVDDDRHARQLPPGLHPRFRYSALRDNSQIRPDRADEREHGPAGRQVNSFPPRNDGVPNERERPAGVNRDDDRRWPDSRRDDRHPDTEATESDTEREQRRSGPVAAPSSNRPPEKGPSRRQAEQQQRDAPRSPPPQQIRKGDDGNGKSKNREPQPKKKKDKDKDKEEAEEDKESDDKRQTRRR